MCGFVRLIAVATLVVASPGLDTGSARAELPEMGECLADAEQVVGSSGPSVICVQWALAWFGYYHGLVTGNYDQGTADAVAAFQKAHPPLRANGSAGQQTLLAMSIYSGVDNVKKVSCLADAPLEPGDRGQSTECLQQALQGLGLFDGAVDGSYGAATRDAVKVFQLNSPPINVDGVAGTQTLAALGIWSGFTNEGAASFDSRPWWPSAFQAEPNWRVNSEGIPYFGRSRACSRANADIIAHEFAKDGADASTQQFFIYIASREGGCDYTAVNFNMQTHDDSHCTFQLNALSGMFEPNAELGRRGWNVDNVKASMANCADAASDLWVFCARGPWTPPYSCAPPWEGDLGPEGDV